MSIRILIIDDSEDDRYIVVRTLTRINPNYVVVEAASASDALTCFEDGADFDFMFLDYMLPDLDGIGLLKKFYDSQSDLGPCPIIIFTGQGIESVATEAIRYGAQDYLIKEHISRNTLEIAMARSKEIFDLKRDHNEAKAFLEHSQKMDVIGKLTGGIAHDFNNLLTITYGNAELLHDLLQMPDVDMAMCIKRVEVIQRATSRGADLVKRLMVFARQRTLEPMSVGAYAW
jgi:two-component system cell cycle sensor histidine kinase/response regulator CckA